MTFQQSFPTISFLIGKENSSLLDRHFTDLNNGSEEDNINHDDECAVGKWCALNATEECRDELELIEWSLRGIVSGSTIDESKLRNAFSDKAKNPDQFDELLAEIAVAKVCATRAKLLDLEWKTRKGDCDADVRCEIAGEKVNLEVTLRTDDWLDKASFDLEDGFDMDGNQIGNIPSAKSRRTLTDRQLDDLRDTNGLVVPQSVSDVIEKRKRNTPTTKYVTDFKDIPQEFERKFYYAEGDEPRVESRNVQRCIESKVKKFNADGFHIVVLATLRLSSPNENSVFDAVFGQTPHIKHHGLFENGLNNEIIGVLYFPVYEQLRLLKGIEGVETAAKLFPNHNSTVQASEELQNGFAKVFDAEIRRGWIDQ